jgi:hypothetical protein
MRFRLNDVAALLTGEREELCDEYTRAIRLLQFQTWIYWPRTNRPATAALMAAALILDKIEEDVWSDEFNGECTDLDRVMLFKPRPSLPRLEELREIQRTAAFMMPYLLLTAA